MVIVVIGAGNWDMGNSFGKFHNKTLKHLFFSNIIRNFALS